MMEIQRKWTLMLLLALLVGLAPTILAQEANQSNEPASPGWRKFGEPAPAAAQSEQLPPSSEFTLPAGSWITVRVSQPLSSDHNQPGDSFIATLAQPIVANGRVIARRGQTVGGVVAEVEKAGRVKGTSRLGLQLTELSLVDGRQIQINTRFIERRGDTSVGQDAAAIGTTTAVGAAIGAVADGGFGAGMGAIAGAAASTIGVLVTRGRATVVYPETLLAFRLETPVTILADSSPEAFQAVTQRDYEQRSLYRHGPSLRPPPPYYFSGYYPPYFYGPTLFFYSGPRYYNRGFYRRW